MIAYTKLTALAAAGAIGIAANAGVSFYTDEAAWLEAVKGVEQLTTNASGVGMACELKADPEQNDQLGPLLTFDATNTGMMRSFTVQTLEPGAGFTFSDGEASPASPGYENALSVGDINNFEDDDWQVTLTGGPAATAFAFGLNDNGDLGDSPDVFSVLDAKGKVLACTSHPPTSQGTVAFFGVVSDVPIASVIYDDDTGGDDIAVSDFRFATAMLVCETDLSGDNVVDTLDLLALLGAWGECESCCPPDLNDDGFVDTIDLLTVLGGWGPCK